MQGNLGVNVKRTFSALLVWRSATFRSLQRAPSRFTPKSGNRRVRKMKRRERRAPDRDIHIAFAAPF